MIIYADDVEKGDLLCLARGVYQRKLLEGDAMWSGSDLRGKACEYSGSYGESRDNLAARIREAGYPLEYCYRLHGGRKVLVVGARGSLHAAGIAAAETGDVYVDHYCLRYRSLEARGVEG